MALPLQDFGTLVKTQASAVTTSCQQLIDMTIGSVTRALLEANASIGLWIQWLIVQALAATRAVTSIGSDLDSWVADFGMTRFAAVAASGLVVFSRTTPGLATTISPGVLVRTGLSPTDQTFTVVEEPTSPAWNGTAYTLAALDFSVAVRVVAQQGGSAGNVVAGSVATLATAIPGVDAVSNPSALSGGIDAETDGALRARFAGFLDSRNRATDQAVGYAISSVQQGVTYTIADRVDASGAARAGHFTVTVDDGSGAPSSDFLARVADVVDRVRPIGATFSLRPPLIIPVSVALHAVGSANALASIESAVSAYISAMPIGATLTVTRLYQVAYGADPGITNVSGATINGSAADFIPPVFGLLRPAGVAVIA